MYDENTGMYWKNKGNEAYQNKEYEEALKLYSKAIVPYRLLRKKATKVCSSPTGRSATVNSVSSKKHSKTLKSVSNLTKPTSEPI